MQGILRNLICSLLFLTFAIFAFGQAETGNISGIVADPNGASLAGARITTINLGTGLTRTDVSTSNGSYVVTNLPPGRYQVNIEASGFAPFKQNIEVTVGGRQTLDAKLAVAGASTTVEVTAEGGAQVNTQDQTLSQVVNTAQIASLPSLTRDPYDFVATAGNVSSDPNGSTSTGTVGGGVGVAFNGQRSASTNILLDGGENVDLFTANVGQAVPLDSVQEYRVVTSDFTAEMGRAGGGVVNVATKSGTNTYHGSAYEYNRISALAANTYDESAQNFIARQTGGPLVPHDRFTRNQFGYSFGGPVLPALKNKVFFFSNTEWTRVRSLGSQLAFVPTPQFLALTAPATQAYFSQFGKLRSSAVPTGIVATDSTGAPITSGGVPVFEQVRYKTNFEAGAGNPQDAYSTVFRMDFNLTDKTQIFGRYALQRDTLFPGVIGNSAYTGYDTGETDSNQNFLANIAHLFSPNVVSTTKLAYNRYNIQQPLGAIPASPGLNLFRQNTASTVNGVNIILPGYLPTTPGNALPFGGPQNLYEVNQDLSWVKGRHNFKFGGLYLQARDNRVFGAYQTSFEQIGQNTLPLGITGLLNGTIFTFQGAVDPQGKFPCFKDPNTGDTLLTSDCTLALPAVPPNFARNNRYNDGAVYAQDSWKITPRFTANLGVRWEYYGVQHNAPNQNLDSNYYFGSGATFFDQIRNGRVLIAPQSPVGGLWDKRFGNFAPRVGFAWDVMGDGKTSLRGGYGIGYERNFGNVTFNVIQNPPAYAVVSLVSGRDVPTQPITSNNAGPLAGSGISVPLLPTSLRAVDPHINTAYAHIYSLAVEREVVRNTIVAIEYSGSRGIHQYSISNFNKPGFGAVYEGDGGAYGPNGPLPCASATFTPGPGQCLNPSGRLQTQYTNINFRGSNGDSYYNGVNVRLQSSNFANFGLQLVANYTYSHAIDNLSSTFSTSGNNFNLGYLDPFNPGIDHGNADYDTRHRFVFSGVYEPTFLAFKNSSKTLRNIAGGWQFAPIFTVRTGTPYSIYDCTNAVTSCPRILAVPGMSKSGNAVAIPGEANNYSYLPLPTAATNPYVDPITGAPDIPTCSGSQGAGCVLPSPGIGRNSFLSPSNWNFNLGAYKNFAVTERVQMQLRGEFYNILNHHNFYVNAANADISATSFIQAKKGASGNIFSGIFPGTPSAADERRNIQLALRIQF
jgi:outer membrane receptor protein involved in Fe transport